MCGSKECFKCKRILPLTEFYKHSAMADGHLNKCKECTKIDVHLHRENNIEKIRAYDRERSKLQHRLDAYAERTKRRRQEDKQYLAAHNAVARAIKKGVLVRVPCIRCGRDEDVHAHHDDYSKPLDVMWLCPICHNKRHKELELENREVF